MQTVYTPSGILHGMHHNLLQKPGVYPYFLADIFISKLIFDDDDEGSKIKITRKYFLERKQNVYLNEFYEK